MRDGDFPITIQDFSPGIYSDDHVTHGGVTTPGGSIFRNGAATVQNTYRCVSDVSGALVPLPARQQRMVEGTLPLGAGNTSKYPVGHEESWQLDIKVISPVSTGASPVYNDLTSDDAMVAVIHTFFYDTGDFPGSAYFYSLVRLYVESFVSSSPPSRGSSPVSVFDVHFYRSANSVVVATPIPVMHLAFGNFVHTISHPSSENPNNVTGLGTLNPLLGWIVVGYDRIWSPMQQSTATLTVNEQAITTYDTDVGTGFIADGSKSFAAGLHQSGTAGSTFPLTRVGIPAIIVLRRPVEGWGPLTMQGTLLVGHQGRLISCFGNLDINGANQVGPVNAYGGDQLWFTYYPTFNLHTGTNAFPDYAGQIVAFPENSTGFGVVASLDAQNLLVINHTGGGGVISGSLNSPTVNQMPHLHSTHGISCIGVSTPMGFIYGGRFGVYLYAGGRTQCISPQLSGFFWDVLAAAGCASTHVTEGNRGRFAWWDPYVLAPANWLYDSRSNSWWRLEQPTSTLEPYMAYDVSAAYRKGSGKLYAMPWRKTTTSTVTYDRYDHYTLAPTYSWQSQPLIETRDKLITAHEIEFAAVPAPGGSAASITVTLTGVDEDGNQLTPFTTTVSLTASNPRPQHKKILVDDFSAYYMQLRIETSATGTAAPKIMPGLTISCRDDSGFVVS